MNQSIDKSQVEVKRERFSRSALGQLLEYMLVFNLRQGIAVAPKLSVTLPTGIRFVKVDPQKAEALQS